MAVRPDGGGNPNEDARKQARGYDERGIQSLYQKFEQAVAAYNANPSVATANAMSQALQLLQDAAANGQNPNGQTLASTMSTNAQQQFDAATSGTPNMGNSTGGAVAASPRGAQGFQGGLAAPIPGGTELGAGADAGNNVGSMGIANRIAQSLISQNPGADARGQTIGGAAQTPNLPPNGGQTGIAGPYANNPETFTGVQGPQVPNVQLDPNYGAGWQQNQNVMNGQLPGGGTPTVTGPDDPNVNPYVPDPAAPPTQPVSGAGMGPDVQLPGNYRAGNLNQPITTGPTYGPGSPIPAEMPLDSPVNAPPGGGTGTANQSVDPSSWWAEAGINTGNQYTTYNPFDTKGGGFNNVLNAYESQNDLPGYWSEQMGPLLQQMILTSYLGDNPLDTGTEVLNALPGMVQQLSTPGSYYDPTADWSSFLSNPVTGPGNSSGVDAFSAQSPQDQIGWVQQMWQTIAGQSVDPQYASSGSYQIQALGDAYIQAQAQDGYTGNFLDFLRLNGAESWL